MNIQTFMNMNGNEIQNVVIQSLSVEPSNPKEGQIYYDNKLKKTYQYNGKTWNPLGGAATEKPQLVPLNYLDETSQNAGGGSYFTLEANGRVTLDIGVDTTMDNGANKTILQLPTNARPQRIIYFPTYQNSDKCGTGFVDTDGSVIIQGPSGQKITAIAQVSYFCR